MTKLHCFAENMLNYARESVNIRRVTCIEKRKSVKK